MLRRIAVIALNSYREAVRARILYGLLALALGTAAYAVLVGEFASTSRLRVVSDLGAASISLYAVIVAVVLGATSLYRELELKTVYPILTRPIRRTEYLVGKYLGILLTLVVFVSANAAVLLLSLAVMAGGSTGRVIASVIAGLLLGVLAAWKLPRIRTYVPLLWAVAMLIAGSALSSVVPDDQRVVLGASLLSLCEVAIVAAIATIFSAFSSPFLTAIYTFGVFLVGRSADTLANLPPRVFGRSVQAAAEALSHIVPNLMLYVPPRALLTGETPGASLAGYIGGAALHAAAWAVLLVAFAAIVFRRRDFA